MPQMQSSIGLTSLHIISYVWIGKGEEEFLPGRVRIGLVSAARAPKVLHFMLNLLQFVSSRCAPRKLVSLGCFNFFLLHICKYFKFVSVLRHRCIWRTFYKRIKILVFSECENLICDFLPVCASPRSTVRAPAPTSRIMGNLHHTHNDIPDILEMFLSRWDMHEFLSMLAEYFCA